MQPPIAALAPTPIHAPALATITTPPNPAAIPLPASPHRRAAIATMPELAPFIGNDTLSCPDFLKQFRNLIHALGITDNVEKLSVITNYFKDKSTADKWFKVLGPGNTALTSFTAFEVHFQGIQEVVKSPEQPESELPHMQIAMDELVREYVNVCGVNVYTIVDFANRVENATTIAGAECKSRGLWEFRNNLPAIMQECVSGLPVDWSTAAGKLCMIRQSRIKNTVKVHLTYTALQNKVAPLSYTLEHAHISTAPVPASCVPSTTPNAATPHAPIPPTLPTPTPFTAQQAAARTSTHPTLRPRETDSAWLLQTSMQRWCQTCLRATLHTKHTLPCGAHATAVSLPASFS
ncbi:hypothetical protein B0H10DRAFT_1957494 [Mycena sp. CBHHK59/15]|nr:hypothetical protein B0H10DRAFT_1957494 [Mycena sp. CBHHK59/15]